jgi:hypothetical protein
MLPDSDMKLTGEHFRKVVRRIESIVPLAGDNITIQPKDGGHEISAELPALNIITLNVCLNGTPSTIEVYGPLSSEAFGV